MRHLLAAGLALFLVGEARAAEEVTVLDGLVTLDLPDDFGPMSDEILRIKYPRGNPPDYAYSDETTEIAVSLGRRARPPGATTAQLADAMAEMLPRLVPIDAWLDHGQRDLSGQTVAYMHFRTPALESDEYVIENYQVIWMFSAAEMLLINFSCTTNNTDCDSYRDQVIEGMALH